MKPNSRVSNYQRNLTTNGIQPIIGQKKDIVKDMVFTAFILDSALMATIYNEGLLLLSGGATIAFKVDYI